MTAELVFSAANALALCGWLLLAAFPRRRAVTAAICGAALPALLSTLYLCLLLSRAGHAQGGFGTLAGVRALFADSWLLLAGWIHYLAFDLFIGSWEARDAQRRGVPRWALLPCLALTFMFGPAGLLSWLGARRLFGREPLRAPSVS
jgi:hypothetical protein